MSARKITFATICITILVMTATTLAQPTEKPARSASKKAAAGASFGHYGFDPGLAVEISTRPFFRHSLSARFAGGVHWMEAHKATYHHWATYHALRVSVAYHLFATERARIYAELGVTSLFPGAELSDKRYVAGFIAFHGLEVTLVEAGDGSICLFLGAGPTFVQACAEKLEGSPRYGNGVVLVCGVRFYR